MKPLASSFSFEALVFLYIVVLRACTLRLGLFNNGPDFLCFILSAGRSHGLASSTTFLISISMNINELATILRIPNWVSSNHGQ